MERILQWWITIHLCLNSTLDLRTYYVSGSHDCSHWIKGSCSTNEGVLTVAASPGPAIVLEFIAGFLLDWRSLLLSSEIPQRHCCVVLVGDSSFLPAVASLGRRKGHVVATVADQKEKEQRVRRR
ncbi:hypothetical protein DM860_017820 [Cuscuta australis]|uniref:NYN domain-containing protein n=1 Tax=Cuscuta australis TaxID=267555 RepID=A0A328DUY6_9ASTE|nr:hypothetical protein DM860_017820 [Cuscuta australis]